MDYKLMTKPALFLQWNVGCNHSLNRPVEEEILIQPLIASLSILAFIFNTVAIVIFVYQSKRTAMRFNLISLSAAESLFNGILTFYFLLSCTDLLTIGLAKRSVPPWERVEIVPRLYKIVIILMDVMVCTRNWCNLLIAASRAEVISSSIGKKKFFKKSTMYKIIGVLFMITLPLAVLRNCDVELLICEEVVTKLYYSQQRPYLSSLILKVFTLVWFVIQCIIPWIGVVICSIIMTSVICSNFKKHQNLVSGSSRNQRRRNTSTALRTVLGLALTFTICELPTFIFTIISGMEISGMDKFKSLILLANSLIVIDSIVNFCVYAVAMPEFREGVWKLIRCQNLKTRGNHNIFSSTNYPFAKCNASKLLLKKSENPSKKNKSENK